MRELPSSDAETDKMEGMDERESELEHLSGRNSDSNEHSDVKDNNSTDFKEAIVSENNDKKRDLEDEGSHISNKKSKTDSEKEGDDGGDDEDEDEDEEDEKKSSKSNEDNDYDETEREKTRIDAMSGLKEIEILFAQLKDKLFETQLKKLEFELKLCQENKHPDLIEYINMADEDFKKKTTRLLHLRKYKLKCLDNQTRANRVAIHQQYLKNTSNLDNLEILNITKDWYDINKERRVLDLNEFNLPDHYQFNKSIRAFNIENYLPNLINQRNEIFREISILQGMIDFKKLIPSALNNLKGCSKEEINNDLKEMGL